MRRPIPALLVLLLASLSACSGTRAHRSTETPDETRTPAVTRPVPPTCAECRAALPVNGWCETCQLGYVAAIPISSKPMHDALDAHGHPIPDWSHPCIDCNDALLVDGFCPRDQFGFVDGMLYFTELTWSLGLGTVVDLSTLECLACATHGRDGTETAPVDAFWCEACARGIVGNVAFTDRARFDRAAERVAFLRTCLVDLDRCEMCAITGFFGLECGVCRRRAEGRPAASDSP